NEIIDRRAMVFSGKEKKKDKDKDDADKKSGDDADKKSSDDSEKKAEGDKPADDSKAEGEKSDDAPAKSEGDDKETTSDEPGTIKQKPGGCGCRIEDAQAPAHGAVVLVGLGLAAFGLRRRRAA